MQMQKHCKILAVTEIWGTYSSICKVVMLIFNSKRSKHLLIVMFLELFDCLSVVR